MAELDWPDKLPTLTQWVATGTRCCCNFMPSVIWITRRLLGVLLLMCRVVIWSGLTSLPDNQLQAKEKLLVFFNLDCILLCKINYKSGLSKRKVNVFKARFICILSLDFISYSSGAQLRLIIQKKSPDLQNAAFLALCLQPPTETLSFSIVLCLEGNNNPAATRRPQGVEQTAGWGCCH